MGGKDSGPKKIYKNSAERSKFHREKKKKEKEDLEKLARSLKKTCKNLELQKGELLMKVYALENVEELEKVDNLVDQRKLGDILTETQNKPKRSCISRNKKTRYSTLNENILKMY